MNTAAQEAALRAAIAEAHSRSVELSLPVLEGETSRAEIVGLLVRDRALTLIERDLVSPTALRRRKAPFTDERAVDWWAGTLLPLARTRTEAAWWLRRAPRDAIQWAITLDSENAGKAGHR